jgi:hypothetical protein
LVAVIPASTAEQQNDYNQNQKHRFFSLTNL